MNGIEFYRYELVSRGALNARSGRRSFAGALIRAGGGYGCIHPWPELGDGELEEQLRSLREGEGTELVQRAIQCVLTDGAARKAGRSLFDGLEIPESHAIVREAGEIEELLGAGFSCFKVKCGVDPAGDAARLASMVEAGGERFRLDFNESLSAADFESLFWDGLSAAVRDRVEFVEDPCPYDESIWTDLHRRTGAALAVDRGTAQATATATVGFQRVVIKPAVDDCNKLVELAGKRGCQVVVTSYMDHPVGQYFAAFEAARLRAVKPELVGICGLMTHGLFEGDAFCAAVKAEGARLLPPAGTGLGFDELLESLPWKPLI